MLDGCRKPWLHTRKRWGRTRRCAGRLHRHTRAALAVLLGVLPHAPCRDVADADGPTCAAPLRPTRLLRCACRQKQLWCRAVGASQLDQLRSSAWRSCIMPLPHCRPSPAFEGIFDHTCGCCWSGSPAAGRHAAGATLLASRRRSPRLLLQLLLQRRRRRLGRRRRHCLHRQSLQGVSLFPLALWAVVAMPQ